jgi:Ran GTPase-activating protein (RanGAP) involved in mRNA processing and transport
VGVHGARELSHMILNNKYLNTLILEGNNIRSEGAKYIAEALKENQSINTLNLGSNNIRRDGAKAIAEALKVNDSITEISLKNNAIKGTKFISVRCKLLQMKVYTLLLKQSNTQKL